MDQQQKHLFNSQFCWIENSVQVETVTVCRLKRGGVRNKIREQEEIRNADRPINQTPVVTQQRVQNKTVPKIKINEPKRLNDRAQQSDSQTKDKLFIDADKPAARKIREPDVYHEIAGILECSQAADNPIRIKVRFIDRDIRWLPIECFNRQAVELYRSLNLTVHKVEI